METLSGGNCIYCGVKFSNSLRLSNHEAKCFIEFNKRHTCIICKRKRYERNMKNVFGSSWACTDKYYFQTCYVHNDIYLAKKIIEDIKKLTVLSYAHIKNK